MGGRVPWWYPPIRAARYLGVGPWEIEEGVSREMWRLIALTAERAEA